MLKIGEGVLCDWHWGLNAERERHNPAAEVLVPP